LKRFVFSIEILTFGDKRKNWNPSINST